MDREERVVGVIKNVPNRQGALGVWLLTGTYERILDALERLDACERERDEARELAAQRLKDFKDTRDSAHISGAVSYRDYDALREDARALAQNLQAFPENLVEDWGRGSVWCQYCKGQLHGTEMRHKASCPTARRRVTLARPGVRRLWSPAESE